MTFDSASTYCDWQLTHSSSPPAPGDEGACPEESFQPNLLPRTGGGRLQDPATSAQEQGEHPAQLAPQGQGRVKVMGQLFRSV